MTEIRLSHQKTTKTRLVMKSIKLTSLAAIAVLTASSCLAQTNKNAVNIVFTEPGKTQVIDTVIAADNEALENLLSAFNLDRSTVHIVDLAGYQTGANDEHQPRMMFIEVDAEDVNGDASTSVRVIEMDGEEMTLEEKATWIAEDLEIVAEELALIEEKIESKVAKHMNESKMEIHVIDDETGEETKVEITEKNGDQKMKGTKNGKKMSDKEIKAFMREHKKPMELAENSKAEAELAREIEIITRKAGKGRNVHVEHAEKDIKAVVIVKAMSQDKTDHAAHSENSELAVFPNPAKDKANVSFENIKGEYTLTLRTIKGDVVWEIKDQADGKLNAEIDLKGLSAGTYILNLNHSNGMQATRLVIE